MEVELVVMGGLMIKEQIRCGSGAGGEVVLMIKEQIEYVNLFNSKCKYNIYYSSPSAFRGNPAAAWETNYLLSDPAHQSPSNPLSILLLPQLRREN